MQITLDSYIKNPSGGRATMAGQRDAAAAVYGQKFNTMILKTAGRIDYKLYKQGKDDERFIFYMKMPSESVPDLFYDVVLDFYAKDDVIRKSTKLNDYYVRFFSNDPNFTFTYAYTFKKNQLLVPELMNKLDPRSLKEKPKVTNPHVMVGYAKAIYSAYLLFDMKGLWNKALWYNAPPYKNGSALQHLIMSTPNKLAQTDRLRKLHAASKHGSVHIGDINNLDDLSFKVKQVKSIKAAKDASERVHQGYVRRTKEAKRVSKVKYIR